MVKVHAAPDQVSDELHLFSPAMSGFADKLTLDRRRCVSAVDQMQFWVDAPLSPNIPTQM
jgi:hypothetical protein